MQTGSRQHTGKIGGTEATAETDKEQRQTEQRANQAFREVYILAVCNGKYGRIAFTIRHIKRYILLFLGTIQCLCAAHIIAFSENRLGTGDKPIRRETIQYTMAETCIASNLYIKLSACMYVCMYVCSELTH